MLYYIIFTEGKEFKRCIPVSRFFNIQQPINYWVNRFQRGKPPAIHTYIHTYIPNDIYFPGVVVFSSTFTKAYTSISPKSSQSLSILPILRDPGNRLKRLNRENIVNTSHLFHISNRGFTICTIVIK